jgi:DNA-binding Lrp family transcriptional regulator
MNDEMRLLRAMENGLDLTRKRPYLALAEKIGLSEDEVIQSISQLKAEGKIKRFGLVIKNRSCGYLHNAMVTFHLPPEKVDEMAMKISQYPFVKLCYQRECLPEWPYNLYCMIHGKSREMVEEQIEQIIKELGVLRQEMRVLFSSRCFKQKGASYYY